MILVALFKTTLKNENGYGDVRELVGHGIQPSIHEDPEVPHWGKAGHGLRLREGMTITVEPMVEAGGDWRIEQKTVSDPNDDGFTMQPQMVQVSSI